MKTPEQFLATFRGQRALNDLIAKLEQQFRLDTLLVPTNPQGETNV